MAPSQNMFNSVTNLATKQDHQSDFDDPERFGRPLHEVPLFQTASIPPTLASKNDTCRASKLQFRIMACPNARSVGTTEPEGKVVEQPQNSSSRRYKSPNGWNSKLDHHSKARRSSSRHATASCTCKRKKKASKLEDERFCLFCHVKETPKWRDGPLGRRTLCNVCGLVYAKRESRARSSLLERELSGDSTVDSSGSSS